MLGLKEETGFCQCNYLRESGHRIWLRRKIFT